MVDSEFQVILAEADRLCQVVDSEEKPFESKYQAREILEQARADLEAGSNADGSEISQTAIKMAIIDTKLGIIAHETEENHVAETKLNQALDVFCPGFVKTALEISGPVENTETSPADQQSKISNEEAAAAAATRASQLSPAASVPEALAAANRLGLLWSGRGEPRRALVFLAAAERLGRALAEGGGGGGIGGGGGGAGPLPPPPPPPPPAPAGDRVGGAAAAAAPPPPPGDEAAAAARERVEQERTLNLFYLAQVWGHLGDAARSARYCRDTLARQLLLAAAAAGPSEEGGGGGGEGEGEGGGGGGGGGGSGLNREEWVKNCMGLADYYLGTNCLQAARCCLEACCPFLDRLAPAATPPPAAQEEEGAEGKTGQEEGGGQQQSTGGGGGEAAAAAAEGGEEEEEEVPERLRMLRADHDRRRGLLWQAALQVRSELETLRCAGMEGAAGDLVPDEAALVREVRRAFAAPLAEAEAARGGPGEEDEGGSSGGEGTGRGGGGEGAPSSRRRRRRRRGGGLPPLPAPGALGTFEQARDVFKEANACYNRAKDFYLLDGFVTDHVDMLRRQSQLYRLLAGFESDDKRKQAMHTRRINLLEPLLSVLNKKVFMDFHKQLSYEVAETFSSIVDIKIGRIEAKKTPKKAELEKCNDFVDKAISNFQYFADLYMNDINPETKEENSIPKEQLGPFLRSHFHIARLHGKKLYKDSKLAVASLSRSVLKYEWLLARARRELDRVGDWGLFQQEYDICRQMVELLPEKINRMHHGQKAL